MTTELYINDFPLGTLGLRVDDPADWLGSPRFSLVSSQLLYRAGELPLALFPEADVRSLSVRCYLDRRSAGLAAHRAALDEIKERCTHGMVELRFVDEPTICSLAYLAEVSLDDYLGPKLLTPFCRLTLRFKVLSAYRYAKDGVTFSFAQVQTPCPLGSAPSLPIITLTAQPLVGSAVNPTVTLRDNGGNVVATMVLTNTIAVEEALEINCETGQIRKFATSGAATSAQSALSAASDLLVLRPSDGDFAAEDWPTLETSVGIGTARYRKNYL